MLKEMGGNFKLQLWVAFQAACLFKLLCQETLAWQGCSTTMLWIFSRGQGHLCKP